MLDPLGRKGRHTAADGFLHDWGFNVGTNIVVDASGIGQLLGTDASVPVAAQYPPHPITTGFQLMTAYPLARSVDAGGRRRQRHTAAVARADQPAELGGSRPRGAEQGRWAGRAERRQGRSAGADPLGAAVSAPATDAPTPEKKPDARRRRGAAQTRIARGGDRRLRLRHQRVLGVRATATSS